jgi:O-antigen ligase
LDPLAVAAPPAHRSSWRPPRYLWALAGLAALAAVARLFPDRLEGPWLVLTPLAIAAGTWALKRLWEVPPAATVCAAVVATIFSGAWSEAGLGGIPLNRLLLAFVLLQFLLRAPGVAELPSPRVRNVHLLMCATILFALASAAAAGRLDSQEGMLSLLDVLGATPFLVFFLAPVIFAGERERALLLGALVGLGLYLGLTALCEALGPHVLVFPSYILRSDGVTPGLVQVGGPFQSPVAEGFATFACAVAAVICLFRWQARWQRLVAAAACLICLFACFATLERGVWVAAVVGAAAAAAATRRGRRLLIPTAIAAALVIVGILAVSATLAEHTSQRADYQQSVWDRQNQMAAGLRMVQERPLLGFGWDRYRADSEDYFRQASTYPLTGHTQGVTIGLPPVVLPLHNTYLAYMVELGLIGFLLWFASVAGAVAPAILKPGPPALRAWKLGLIALGTFFLVVSFFDPHEQPFPVILLLLWAGVAYGPPLARVAAADPAPPALRLSVPV